MTVKGIGRWLPGVAVARTYERAWLWPDVRAGIVVTALLIPAGMGYAEVAGLPPRPGLYATIVPLLAYAVFGPSRILVLGPDSALAPIIAAAILPLALGDERAGGGARRSAGDHGRRDPARRRHPAPRLRHRPAVEAHPRRLPQRGRAARDHLAGAQAARILDRRATSPARDVVAIVAGHRRGRGPAARRGVRRGIARRHLRAQLAALARCRACWSSSCSPTAITAILGLADSLPVVGALPQGLPAPALGGLEWADVGALALPAAGIALVAFTDSAVLSRTFAARRGESVDGSQEMAGIGVANIAGGFLGGFPVLGFVVAHARRRAGRLAHAAHGRRGRRAASSPSSSSCRDSRQFLPVRDARRRRHRCAAVSLIDVRGFRRLVRMDKVDAALSLAAFLGVRRVRRARGHRRDDRAVAARVRHPVVAAIPGGTRPGARAARLPRPVALPGGSSACPGIVIVRFDAPLFFANGAIFDDCVRSRVEAAGPGIHTVILAAEPITDIDTTAIDELVELDDYLAAHGIRLMLAEMKDPVIDVLRQLRADASASRPTDSPRPSAPPSTS